MSILQNTTILKNDFGIVSECYIGKKKGKNFSSNRKTFVFPDEGVVLKFDNERSSCGIQNRQEIENYSYIAPEDLKFFAKLIEHGYVDGELCVVQEFVKNERSKPTEDEFKNWRYLVHKYDLSDFCIYEDGDYDPSNLSLTKDGLKIYDLGYESCMDNGFAAVED